MHVTVATMIRGSDKALRVGRTALLLAALGLAITASLAGEVAAVGLTLLAAAAACLAWVASVARALGRFLMPTARDSAHGGHSH
jgi:hypothetical protein